MKLLNSSDIELNYIRALLHGDTGSGKTTSLGTLPEDSTIIAVGERGLIPLRHRQYKVLPFRSWDDIRDLCRFFLAPERIEDKVIQAAVKSCKFLAIDSLSEISELCMTHIIRVDRGSLIKERTDGKRDTPKGTYEDLMQREDWGLYGKRILNLVSTVCHLPCHIVCMIRSRWTFDGQGGEKQCLPGLAGRIAPPECPALFDLVMHMEATTAGEGKPGRVWRTFNDGIIYAKDSSGILKPYEPTDWTKLFKKILKKGDTK